MGSMNREGPLFMKATRPGTIVAVVVLYATVLFRTTQSGGAPVPQVASTPGSSLDLEVYKTRIEPVFLKQREDGMRCYNCHSILNTRLRLQPILPGSTSWTDEQSRQNFETVSKLVTP